MPLLAVTTALAAADARSLVKEGEAPAAAANKAVTAAKKAGTETDMLPIVEAAVLSAMPGLTEEQNNSAAVQWAIDEGASKDEAEVAVKAAAAAADSAAGRH